jgi:hypothetical protein
MKKDLNRCADKYKKEAEDAGLVYLGEATNKSSYRRYKFISCLHETNILPQNVRNKEVDCKQCVYDKITQEANNQHLKIVKKNNRHSYVYELPCGCNQIIHTSAVRSGEWICRKCTPSHFRLVSYIYLLEISSNNFSWLKLGYSRNIGKRIKYYDLVQSKVDVVFNVKIKTGKEAIKLEKELHFKYKQEKLCSTLMKSYHRRDGFTECYPLCMKETLLEELCKLNRKENLEAQQQ